MRHFDKKEFLSSLEIVRDNAKIKNIRVVNEDYEAYCKNYERIFGRGEPVKGSTGVWKYDEKLKKLVKISDEIPASRLIAL